jgi:hypothetical protein
MRLYFSLLAAVFALSLGACGTSRHLPAYERPLARPIFSKSARPLIRTPSPITSNTGIAPRWAVSSTQRRRQPHRAPFRSRERSIAPPGTAISRIAYISPSQPFLADNFSSQTYGSAAA